MNNILQSGTTSRIAALRANTPRGPVAPEVKFLANQANAPMAPMTMYNKGKTIQAGLQEVPSSNSNTQRVRTGNVFDRHFVDRSANGTPPLSPSGLTYAPTQTPMIPAPPVAAPVNMAQLLRDFQLNRNSRFR